MDKMNETLNSNNITIIIIDIDNIKLPFDCFFFKLFDINGNKANITIEKAIIAKECSNDCNLDANITDANVAAFNDTGALKFLF